MDNIPLNTFPKWRSTADGPAAYFSGRVIADIGLYLAYIYPPNNISRFQDVSRFQGRHEEAWQISANFSLTPPLWPFVTLSPISRQLRFDFEAINGAVLQQLCPPGIVQPMAPMW